jgi:hypothetical protein
MAKTKPRLGPDGEPLKQINFRVPKDLVEAFEQLLRESTKRFGLKTSKTFLFAEVLRLGIRKKEYLLKKFKKEEKKKREGDGNAE